MAFPPNYTNVWDVTFPPDTQLANLLGQDLRNFRTDIMQRLSLLSGILINRPSPEILNATWGGAGFGLLYFATDTKQVFQWNGAAWLDVSGSIGSAVGVVATVSLTGQSALNAGTTLYAVPVGGSGLYRVNFDIVITNAGVGGGSLFGVVSWNNGTAAQSGSVTPNFLVGLGNESFPANSSNNNPIANVTTFFSAASQNITWSVNNQGTVTGVQYSVRIRLEFLG